MVSLCAFRPISAVSSLPTTAEPAVVLQQRRPEGTGRGAPYLKSRPGGLPGAAPPSPPSAPRRDDLKARSS